MKAHLYISLQSIYKTLISNETTRPPAQNNIKRKETRKLVISKMSFGKKITPTYFLYSYGP